MTLILISIVLAELLLIPLAYKWELHIKTVSISVAIIGLLSGLILNSVESMFALSWVAKVISCSVLTFALAAAALLMRFYRDPERIPPAADNVIVSPADGTIKYIKPIKKGNVPCSSKGQEHVKLASPLIDILRHGDGYLVGIAMTYLDVHITRAVISGKITYFKHITGYFHSLKKEDAPYRNERLVEIIENDKCKIGLIQIASRLVRRIVAYVGKGDELNLGQKIGIIKFGSQVDVVLPKLQDLKIKVKVGEQVYGGISIIAEI